MPLDPSQLPDDIAALKAMLIVADKHARDLDAQVTTLKLTIAKLQHERFGPSSERARLSATNGTRRRSSSETRLLPTLSSLIRSDDYPSSASSSGRTPIRNGAWRS
jgi:hypothetical protein